MNYKVRNNVLVLLGIGCAFGAQGYPQAMPFWIGFGVVVMLACLMNYVVQVQKSVETKEAIAEPAVDQVESAFQIDAYRAVWAETIRLAADREKFASTFLLAEITNSERELGNALRDYAMHMAVGKSDVNSFVLDPRSSHRQKKFASRTHAHARSQPHERAYETLTLCR